MTDQAPMHGPRICHLAVALALLASAAACEATDLRGRVDAKNSYTGLSYPRSGAKVQLTREGSGAPVVVRAADSGADGMYYLTGIAPGKYVLVVNGQRFPVVVNNQPYQDVPVVVLR
jgi:hypothetical protein